MSRRRSLSEEEKTLWTGVARSVTPLHWRRSAAANPEPISPAELSAEVADKPGASAKASATAKASDKAKAADKAKAQRRARLLGPAADEPPQKKTPPLAPLGRRLKQRVARGREPIEARLDLHGFTQAQAHAALLRFLRRAQNDGARIALVVTGKGTSKAGEMHERGVLKRQVPLWLGLPEFRALVVGYEDAHIGHGGTGALYVRLRRAERSSD